MWTLEAEPGTVITCGTNRAFNIYSSITISGFTFDGCDRKLIYLQILAYDLKLLL
jgi:hypothetical protein